MRISQPTWSTFVVVCGALGMALQIAGSAQDKPLPPAYPRPGTTLMLENSRVLVWNIAWLKQQYALHRHPYDLMGVYYAPGDRSIVAVDGSRRPVSTKAWETASQKSGVTHVEEGTSDSPLRAVFVEMKEPSPRDGSSSSSDFAKAGGVQRPTTSARHSGSSCRRSRALIVICVTPWPCHSQARRPLHRSSLRAPSTTPMRRAVPIASTSSS